MRRENRDHPERAGTKGDEQVVQLNGFWATKMEDEGPLKRNKCGSKGATSEEGSKAEGEIGGSGEGKGKQSVHNRAQSW